ncbi:hypothetical protein ACJJIW_07175 [Microbulbifer sp. JMSA004]|uniref:hypothetical protein n=1 Tax=Microbulbifer sp. JMSA004 TaxID=3243370 RepID=UPI0040391D5E
MFKKSITALYLCLSSFAYGGNDQVSIDREIYLIRTYEDFAVIYFKPGFTNTQGCPTETEEQVILEFEDSTSKEMYSALLSAATANKKVGFGISGCTIHSLGYPTIYRVDVDF